MNKNIYRTGMAALAAIATSASLVSCASDEPVGPNNGPETQETVKTTLAISLGTVPTKTRQASDIVQADANFRGMEEIFLANLTGFTANTTPTVTSIVPLTALGETDIATDKSSKIYSDVNIPVGTKAFLFYGKAPVSTSVTAPADLILAEGVYSKMAKGSTTAAGLTGTTSGDDAAMTFTHDAITTTGTASETLITLLNGFSGVEGWSTSAEGSDLLAAYKQFTSSSAVAGSSAAILHRLQDLYNFLASESAGAAAEGTVLKALWDKFTTNDVIEVTTEGNVAFKSAQDNDVKNYPTYFGLPEGAAYLTFADDEFKYITTGSVGGANDSKVTVPFSNFVYPADLRYYCATPALTLDLKVEESEWNKEASEWKKNPTTSDKAWGNEVTATTRTIALENNINYAVAQLVTKVKAKAATLEANMPNNTGVFNITIGDASLPLTGVLVGGQHKTVDYMFLPSADKDQVVYDGVMASEIYATSGDYSAPNYTLVFDNYAEAAEEVNIALEFTNNTGVEFQGIGGVVRDGMKFYLVGKLSTADEGGTQAAGSSIAWDSLNIKDANKSYFPQYNKARVFVQDFQTKANVTIGSLKNAYVTVPDLRASLLQLGLSIDLEWKSGLTFDVTID